MLNSIPSWVKDVGSIAVLVSSGFLSQQGSSRIKLCKLLERRAYQEFITTNKQKLHALNAKTAGAWEHAHQHPVRTRIIGRGLICVASGIDTCGSYGLVVSRAAVLGTYGSGVVAVCVLTPFVLDLLKLGFECTRYERVKAVLEFGSKLGRLVSLAAMISTLAMHVYKKVPWRELIQKGIVVGLILLLGFRILSDFSKSLKNDIDKARAEANPGLKAASGGTAHIADWTQGRSDDSAWLLKKVKLLMEFEARIDNNETVNATEFKSKHEKIQKKVISKLSFASYRWFSAYCDSVKKKVPN